MKMRYLLASVALSFGLFALPARAAPNPVAEFRNVQTVAEALQSGRTQHLHTAFAPAMATQVSAEQLATAWTQVSQHGGHLLKVEPLVSDNNKTEQNALLSFERAKFVLQVIWDANGQISGLWLKPYQEPAAVTVDPAVSQQEISFAAPDGPSIQGTIFLPKGVSNPPAIVLVHGSGPQDRYETMGLNRPFLDIANGLAKQGIAVLAYDKRTRTYGKTIDVTKLTIDQESTDDAIAAATWLRDSKQIDPKRVFVLGHSQGGLVLPRILARTPWLRGGIGLAAPGVKLIDLLPHQNEYLLADQVGTPQGQQHMAMIRDGIARIRDSDSKDMSPVFGLPLSYWRSVDAVDPLKELQGVRQPVLFLQGTADFQVTRADWMGLQQLAAKSPARIRFVELPGINHLGLKTEDKRGMDDYKAKRAVAPEVIDAMAAWIKRN